MSGVNMEFRAQARQALAATSKLTRKVVQLEERLKAVGRTSARGAKGRGFSGQIAGVKRLMGAYVGLQGAIRVTSSIMSRASQQASSAMETTRSIAAAQAGFLLNTFNLADDKFEKLKRGLDQIAAKQGITREMLLPAAGAAVSGSGGTLSIQQILQVLRISAQISSAGAEVVRDFTGGTMDIQRASSTGARPFSMRESAGFLAQTGGAARLENIGKVGTAVGKSMGSLISRGFKPLEAQAIFTTTSLIAADRQGRITSRAILNFAGLLDKAFEGAKEKTFAERMAKIEKSPNLQRQWAVIAATSFAAQVRKPFEDIFTPGSPTNIFYHKQRAQFASTANEPAREAALNKMLKRFATAPVERNAKFARMIASAHEEAVMGRGDVSRLGAMEGAKGQALMSLLLPDGIEGWAKLWGEKFVGGVRSGFKKGSKDMISLWHLSAMREAADRRGMPVPSLDAAISHLLGEISFKQAHGLTKSGGFTDTLDSALLQKMVQRFPTSIGRFNPEGREAATLRAREQIGRQLGMPHRMVRRPGVEGEDVRLLLEAARGAAAMKRGTPDLERRHSLSVTLLKHLVETDISKKEFENSTKSQRQEMIDILRLIHRVLGEKTETLFDPHAQIPDHD